MSGATLSEVIKLPRPLERDTGAVKGLETVGSAKFIACLSRSTNRANGCFPCCTAG